MSDQAPGGDERRFRIFRWADAPQLEMHETSGVGEVALAGMQRVAEAGGMDNGHDVRVVFETPGFSLMHCWFKSGYHLPRHSHNADCAYYVLAGSLQIGGETLGKGDGFFLPANVPYAYVAGPEGVEVMEFRQLPCRDIHIMADNPAFWEKMAALAPASRARWDDEPRPSEA